MLARGPSLHSENNILVKHTVTGDNSHQSQSDGQTHCQEDTDQVDKFSVRISGETCSCTLRKMSQQRSPEYSSSLHFEIKKKKKSDQIRNKESCKADDTVSRLFKLLNYEKLLSKATYHSFNVYLNQGLTSSRETWISSFL